ncbi:MAG: response regulator transcription factor [Bacillota bacterium]|nr:response regulator transcription factor [Bacillota bacterium]
MARVLVVDDEAPIRRVVRAYLERDGHQVWEAGDGDEAWRAFDQSHPDLVVLDLLLPGLPGLELLQRIRAAGRTGVILLTARGEEADRVAGLRLGADDYVTKPFSPAELAARAEAVLRRLGAAGGPAPAPGTPEATPPAASLLRIGGLALDPVAHRATLEGRLLDLTPTEFRLLEALMREPGRAFSRGQLAERALLHADDAVERTIDSHVRNLRRKLGDDPETPRYIETVFGVGYRLRAG